MENVKYREVVNIEPGLEEWRDVKLSTGGNHSTLQDIKVSKKAGGYCYKNDQFIRNRFIYWRTYDDILELSEVSLDINMKNRNIRCKFEDSPILSIFINESEDYVTILVTTISNLHRLQFNHPRRSIGPKGEQNESSIFSSLTQETAMDPSSFYNLSNHLSQSVPHKSVCYLAPTSEEAYFAVAYSNHLLLFQMSCLNGHTGAIELKNSQTVPRFFSNMLRGGKSNVNDSNFVSSFVFDTIGGEIVLYALYRDNNIRMWSAKTGQCLSVLNILMDNDERRSIGTQNNVLKKCSSSSTICVFLSYANCSEFQFLKPSWDGGNSFSLVQTDTITAPQFDLVDFELSDQKLWGLWCNSEGEMHISAYLLSPNSTDCWRTAILEGVSGKIRRSVELEMDPKHSYCSYIFYPGKFQSITISKALMMFSRSHNFSDASTPLHLLKDRVCQAIDTEIQNELKMNDLCEDEYLEVAIKYWEKFYSCCEQYHVAAHQPIGLFVLESLDAVCVIKNSLMSFLRPCDLLENMLLSGLCPQNFTNDEKIADDLGKLVKVLYYLENNLSSDVKVEISSKLYQLKMPNNIITDLISEMSGEDEQEVVIPRALIKELGLKLQHILDIPSAMNLLLNLLRLDRNNYSEDDFDNNLSHFQKQLFDGVCGTSLVSESVRQISSSRFALCRNLLTVQLVLVDGFSLNCNAAEIIRSKNIPETVLFLQAYYVMVWIGEEAFATPQVKTNIIGFKTHAGYAQPSSLLQLFIRNKGLYTALKLYSKSNSKNMEDDYETENYWSKNLLSITSYIEKFIWAISGKFIFGEWLAETNQHLLIEEYVRLLNKWCEYNSCSRHFMLATSFLENGETAKALDYFLESAKGVLCEPFLVNFVASNNAESTNEIMGQYYLKVIRLFEKYGVFDCVISIAEVAIGTAEKETQLAMFQSIIFNNHMHMKHYEEAYHALIQNCELSRRKDCLRQLIISLFQEKRFDILINFPYIGLEDDVQNIVETRARSMQIEGNQHYNFLFSYHITKGNMKRAAIVMYEKALRFLHECNSVDSLQARYTSLLACVNALSLVDKDYKWIAKPVIEDPAEKFHGEDLEDDDAMEAETQSQIVVVDLEDIQKELLVVDALLCVAKAKDLSSFLHMGPKELVILLSNEKFFTNALKLAKGYNLSLAPIFESLTLACLKSTNLEISDPLDWLTKNNLSDLTLSVSYNDVAWSYLRKLLEEEDKDKQYYKDVTKHILSSNAFIPQWLLDSYKLSKASELLYLLLQYGRLDEATDLAVEYIRSFLGRASDKFGFTHFQQNTLPSFPINTLDLLLYALKTYSVDDEKNRENYHLLKDTIDYYLRHMNSITLESMVM